MKKPKELKPEELRRTIDPKKLEGEIAAEEIIGQERVKTALKLLEIPDKHYNLFVCGASETGKTKQVLVRLKEIAASKPTPPDVVYVNNFSNPDQPRMILFPAGMAKRFAEELPKIFKIIQLKLSLIEREKDYAKIKTAIRTNLRNKLVERLKESKEIESCKEINLEILIDEHLRLRFCLKNKRQEVEFSLAELLQDYNSHLMIEESNDSAKIKESEKYLEEKYFGKIKVIWQLVETIFRKYARPIWHAYQKQLEELKAKYQENLVRSNLYVLKKSCGLSNAPLNAYLDGVGDAILKNIDVLLANGEEQAQLPPQLQEIFHQMSQQFYKQFGINIISNSETQGAPIEIVTNPTFANLFGYVERTETKDGFLKPTFHNIKGGALHKANGGYLIIDAHNTFNQYLWREVWDALKRTLKDEQIAIGDPREMLGLGQSTLKPEAVPFNGKIIFIGPKWLYSSLNRFDPKFNSLFHKAEVESESNLTPELQKQIASHLRKYACGKTSKPLTPDALARVLEHGLELAESQEKINMQIGELDKLILEANLFADKTDAILFSDVEKALEEKEFRNNLTEERYLEYIGKNFLKTDVVGEKTGEGNALVVTCSDGYEFGYPSKTTCNIFPGDGQITFIDKEVEFTGKIFNKAAEIITSWLKKRLNKTELLFDAAISFEQSYYGLEGDSASIIDTAVLVSEISKIPLRQDLAVTGSMNQKGVIQPIGAVNYKIKGFYKACKQHGLTGTQGVVIPKDNTNELMLRKEIIESVKCGKFHIYPVETIKEALEILLNTDMKMIDKAMNETLKGKEKNWLERLLKA